MKKRILYNNLVKQSNTIEREDNSSSDLFKKDNFQDKKGCQSEKKQTAL
jgi:hypothetical protein